MDKKIVLAEKVQCSGCSACADVCPTKSINLAYTGLHDYPVINEESCIKCGRCMTVCPALHSTPILPHQQNFYCGWSLIDNERSKSTSGGIGTALAREAQSRGYYVCGAGFDANWKLQHYLTTDKNVIDSFRGSKYLKSETFGILKEVGEAIGDGKQVLFTGTPCQCDAVERLIPKTKRSQLITVAIICHGVNSAKVWEDYVNHIEGQNNARLVEYNFRSKSKGWGENSRGGKKLRVFQRFSNGKELDVPAWKNLFHVWFGQHYMLRPSCFHCQYRTAQREADITIGDFWGISKVLPDLECSKGASVVITSTPEGELFLNSCKDIKLISVDGEKTTGVLKGFVENRPAEKVHAEQERNKHFELEYMEGGFEVMAKRYPAPTFWTMLKASIKHRLHI